MVLYHQLNEDTVPCSHGTCQVLRILVLPAALFSSPVCISIFYLIAVLFNHLVPVPGILLPSCLTNIHHLSVRFFPNRINLTKQSHSLTSSRQCPECYLQPSLPSYSEENSNHFPSTVIVPIAVFLSFSIAWF